MGRKILRKRRDLQRLRSTRNNNFHHIFSIFYRRRRAVVWKCWEVCVKTVLLEEVSGMGEDIKNLKDVFIDVKKEETNTENLSKGYNLFLEKKGLPSETVVVEDHYQFLERKIAESRNAIFPSEEIFTTKIIEKFNAFSPLEKASQIAVGENDGEQYYANVLRVFNAFDKEIKDQYLYLQSFMIEHINLDEHTTDEHIGHGKALYPLINKTPDKDIQDFYVNNFKSFKNIRRAISKSS